MISHPHDISTQLQQAPELATHYNDYVLQRTRYDRLSRYLTQNMLPGSNILKTLCDQIMHGMQVLDQIHEDQQVQVLCPTTKRHYKLCSMLQTFERNREYGPPQ